jgi:hypothetical protein
VRELVFALDADAAGQQQWRQLTCQAALRGKWVAGLPAAAYGGWKDASAVWAAGVLAVGHGRGAAAAAGEVLAMPEELREAYAARAALLVADGGMPRADAARGTVANFRLCDFSLPAPLDFSTHNFQKLPPQSTFAIVPSSVNSSLAVSRWTRSPSSMAWRTASPLRAHS